MAVDKLASITINKEGLDLIIKSIRSHIHYLNEWNFGDEYDVNTTPYHELLETMRETYNEVWSDAEE